MIAITLPIHSIAVLFTDNVLINNLGQKLIPKPIQPYTNILATY